MDKKNRIPLLALSLLFMNFVYSQNKDSVAHRNIGVLTSCSILESNGFRVEIPAFFYSGKRHGFSLASSFKLAPDKDVRFGISAGYFLFIEPSFRDISFFLNYNSSFYFENKPELTHIFGLGVQIDLLNRFFMHHSVGLGFQHSASDLGFLNTSGQLKLSIGYYLREIPEVHIKDDWEH